MTRTKYRAALIGCGRKASTIDDESRCLINYSRKPHGHAAALRLLPDLELVAVAGRNEENLLAFRKRWGVDRSYSDYREMLSSEEPDVVIIATQAPEHAELVIAAAEAGAKGIICEKAMCTSLEEADAMIEACEDNRAKLVVNHIRRWHPAYRDARRRIENGDLGELLSLVITCRGPLIHNGSHAFDLLNYFAGEAEWVTGYIPTYSGGDDPGQALVRFRNGVSAHVNLDGRLGLMIDIHGSAGRILIDPSVEGYSLWRYGNSDEGGTGIWYKGGPCKERDTEQCTPEQAVSGQVEVYRDLVEWMEGGSEALSTGYDGRAALELSLAVYSSHLEDGRRVPLPLADRALRVLSR